MRTIDQIIARKFRGEDPTQEESRRIMEAILNLQYAFPQEWSDAMNKGRVRCGTPRD